MISPADPVSVECETSVPVSRHPLRNVWLEADDVAGRVDELQSHESVKSVEQLNGPDSPVLLHLEWNHLRDPLVKGLRGVGATVLKLESDGGEWRCTIRCSSQDEASKFHQHCLDHGLDCTITNVTKATLAEQQLQLTRNQQEALQAALSSGYFAIPRETTLEELAHSLGISDTATSQRIRRGMRRLLQNQLGA
ncbi:helix-turn-helix domain-containing protein [Halogeometricum sp. S3BR5-2]|uniref:Helix-turn-helix domain-containing protein n=1 Tax=Halogeometricum luteum TaxID=2950537 RepID=A0ABU2G359_9EURY|nr:helix-turn-helix domain-containing protein [Halogeometricum sp. S3BR5-2]